MGKRKAKRPSWTTNVVAGGKPYKADLFIDFQALAEVMARKIARRLRQGGKSRQTKLGDGTITIKIREHDA